jgi:predicted RNA binding protein YcfA (HicA-like mRNA interferase family)
VTWHRLKRAGFVEQRKAKGSHRVFVHPNRRQVIYVAVHTKKEVGIGLARRILKQAGVE